MTPTPFRGPLPHGPRRRLTVAQRWQQTRVGKWHAQRREMVRQRDAKLTTLQLRQRRKKRIMVGVVGGVLAAVGAVAGYFLRPAPPRTLEPIFIERRDNGNRVVLIDPTTQQEISRVTKRTGEEKEDFERRIREEKQRIAREARPPLSNREISPAGKFFMTREESLRGADSVARLVFGRSIQEMNYNFSAPAWKEGQNTSGRDSLLRQKGSLIEVSHTNAKGEIEKTFLIVGKNGTQYYRYPTFEDGTPMQDKNKKTGYTGGILDGFLNEWNAQVTNVYVPGVTLE